MTSETEIKRRFWKELSESPFLMIGLEDSHEHQMPMTAQLDPYADHCFWFYTTRENRLAAGGKAMAQFAGKDHHLFACIDGMLTAETDPAIIDRYWTGEVAAWYPGKRQDPNLLMLRFDLGHAEIWLADISLRGMFRMMMGGSVREEMKEKHVDVAL